MTFLVIPSQSRAQFVELTARREVVVSGDATDLEVFRWMVVSRTGTLFLPQVGDGLIRTFSREGRELGRLGRKGAGPGEFLQLNAGGWAGDTLWITDGRQRRTLLFGARGKYLDQVVWPSKVPLPLAVGPEGKPISLPLVPRVWSSDGFLTLVPRAAAPGGSRFLGGLPEDASNVVFSVKGTARSVVPIWASIEPESTTCSRTTQVGSTLLDTRIPFCPTAYNHFAHNGIGFVWLSQTIADQPKGEYTVEAVHSSGRRLLARSVNAIRPEVSKEERDAAARRHSRAVSSLPTGATTRPPLGELPKYHPTALGVFLGEDSTVWVRLAGENPDQATWHRIRPGGQGIGRWVTRSDFTLMAARRGELYGTEENPSGSIDVVRYVFRQP